MTIRELLEALNGNPMMEGQLSRGNVNLSHRPSVPNPEGGMSTVFSESSGQNGREVLYPRVVNGQVLSSDDAWAHYLKTGENLGTFLNVKAAEKMGDLIHKQQEMEPLIDMLLRGYRF